MDTRPESRQPLGTDPDDQTPGRLQLMLRAFKHRNYRLFFWGQIISLVGTWMQSAAQAWLVYSLTHSALLLGLTAFVGQLPVLLLAPVGGMFADRFSRQKILLGTQLSGMLIALILAGLTLSGMIQVWEIFVLAGLLGAVSAFDIPARQSFMVEMVGKKDLLNAIALNSSMVNGARIVGPALAGLVVATVGEGWCFFLNGASYIAVIIGLVKMDLQKRVEGKPPVSALAHIREGFLYVCKTRPVFALLALLGLAALTAMPYAVLLPVFAGDILHGGPQALGLLMASSGLGALIAALSLASRRNVKGLGQWVVGSAAGLGISLMLFSLSRQFWLSWLLLLPTGFFMMIQMSASNTLIQAMVPDTLRGRVMAVYSMMFMGMAPFGGLLAGALAHPLGAPGAVALGGALCVAGAAWFWPRLPRLRDEARRLIVAQGMVGGDPPSESTQNDFAKS